MFAILQVTLRSLKFTLALVTSENTQVSIYETLGPGICLTRASVHILNFNFTLRPKPGRAA